MLKLKSLSKKFAKATALSALSLATFFAVNTAQAQDKLQVCASSAMLNTLQFMQNSSPVKYDLHTLQDSGLLQEQSCDLFITANKQIHLSLLTTGKADIRSLQPFASADLILWTPNPRLFNRGIDGSKLLADKQIKSIAVVDGDVAAMQAFTNYKNLGYLGGKTIKVASDVEAKQLAEDGTVEVALITKPLVTTLTRQSNGSSWALPTDTYNTIDYYAVVAKGTAKGQDAVKFVNILRHDSKTQDLLKSLGFKPL